MALLCYIRTQCKAEFLIELSGTEEEKNVCALLRSLPLESFTLSQWNVTLLYLFHLNRRLRNYGEIHAYLSKTVGRIA